MGRASQLHHVLVDICTNAAHAMKDTNGVLTVTLNDVAIGDNASAKSIGLPEGDYVEIKISDTGTGIAPDIIESIFDPYYTTTGLGEGRGMGLAVALGIVEGAGGKILVESTLAKGSTFTVYLPIIKPERTDDPGKSERLPTGTERILLVDDEVSIVKMGAQVLERLGYRVTTATSSLEALDQFTASPHDFDLVVTDMTMPHMTGDQLALTLMKIRPDIPIVLCTGFNATISEEKAVMMGIKALVQKPVTKTNYAITIRKVLEESSA